MNPSKRDSRMDAALFEEAAEWFVDLNTDEPEPGVREHFDAWLRRSPEHVRAYLSMLPTWEDSSLQPVGSAADIDALVAQANETDNVVTLHKTQPTPGRVAPQTSWRLSRVALAAMLLLACVGAVAVFWLRSGVDTYATNTGEQRSIPLPDGSIVELNTRSRVRVRFTKREREVDLIEGQAQFQVQKDPARAFVVHSGATLVRAVGTEFDVYLKKNNTTVSVLEGRVAVARTNLASPLALLSSGEQVIVPDSGIAAAVPQPSDPATIRAWTQHRLLFRSTPLAEVVAEFNRYNVRQMVLRDPNLGGILISGVFSSTQPAALLRFLSEQPGVAIDDSTDEIRVGSK
jgi:transmembrane sensor